MVWTTGITGNLTTYPQVFPQFLWKSNLDGITKAPDNVDHQAIKRGIQEAMAPTNNNAAVRALRQPAGVLPRKTTGKNFQFRPKPDHRTGISLNDSWSLRD
jgi:hypothetical protein